MSHHGHGNVLGDVREAVMQENIGESVVGSLMNDIVNQSTELMINNHLDRVAIPYTVRCVTSEILDFLHCAFVGQDTGKVVSDGWSDGGLADVVQIDTWARGTIDVKVKKQLTTPVPGSEVNQSALLGATTRSTRRLPSSLSQSKAQLKANEDKAKLAADSKSLRGLNSTVSNVKLRKKSVVATEEEALTANGGAPPKENSAILSPDEEEYANQVKLEQKKKAETRQLAERITKQLEEMKNVSDVVVDSNSGKVIAVKAFDVKNAVSRKAEPKFVVPTQAEVVDLVPKEKAGPRKGGAGGPNANQAKKPRRDGSEFVQEESAYGPMVEGVLPSGGVTVKEGETTKKGDLKVPKTKLSRTEYKKLVDSHVLSSDPMEKGDNTDDPDNPNVKIVQPSPTAHPAQSVEIPKPQAHQTHEARAEFKTQKVAALPSSSPARSQPISSGGISGPDSPSTSPARGAIQDRKYIQQLAEQTKLVKKAHQPTGPHVTLHNSEVLETIVERDDS
jgi:hypothetical protein